MKHTIFVVAFLPFLWACSGSDKQIENKGDGFVPVEKNTNQTITTSEGVDSVSTGSSEVLHIGAEEFRAKIFDYEKSQKWLFLGTHPCIVDFYADWCGPCKMLSPTMDQLAKEYAGQIDFYKINIDKEPEIAQIFQVSSIPALLFCPMKGQPQMSAGLMTKDELKKVITEFVLKK